MILNILLIMIVIIDLVRFVKIDRLGRKLKYLEKKGWLDVQ